MLLTRQCRCWQASHWGFLEGFAHCRKHGMKAHAPTLSHLGRQRPLSHCQRIPQGVDDTDGLVGHRAEASSARVAVSRAAMMSPFTPRAHLPLRSKRTGLLRTSPASAGSLCVVAPHRGLSYSACQMDADQQLQKLESRQDCAALD